MGEGEIVPRDTLGGVRSIGCAEDRAGHGACVRDDCALQAGRVGRRS